MENGIIITKADEVNTAVIPRHKEDTLIYKSSSCVDTKGDNKDKRPPFKKPFDKTTF